VYLEPRFKAPNLRALAARGIQAKKVTGIFPTVTYPAHATLATGCRPARHGIISNTVFDPRDGGKKWYWEAAHLKAVPLWDAAHRDGKKTSVIRWPTTLGAEIDYHFPEGFMADAKASALGKAVSDARKALAEAKKTEDKAKIATAEAAFETALTGERDYHWAPTARWATPGLLEEAKVTAPHEVWDEALVDEAAVKCAIHVIEKYKPELMMIHLVAGDGEQHGNGREHPAVYEAYEKIDAQVGQLLKALDVAGLGSDTNVIVTGDHGFLDTHTSIRPNAILRQAGLLEVDENADPKKVKQWAAFVHVTGGSACVYLRDPSDKAMADRVMAELRSAQNRLKGMFNIVDRETCDREESFPGALCALEAEPGFALDAECTGPVLVQARIAGMHGYMPWRDELATGLVAAGPGLVQGRTLPVFRQLDVAPLAAHLLGVDLGPAVQGTLVPGILVKELQPK
jgi:predicted AlkP superfamily pyrophosphatase or phosphodiesterase